MTDLTKTSLDLTVAAPDRLPLGLTIRGERRVYWIRDVPEYSPRERKRLSGLIAGVFDYERADEEDVTEDDDAIYYSAMRQVVLMTSDVPPEVVEEMDLPTLGRYVQFIWELFTQPGQQTEPQPTPVVEQPKAPTRLRKLRERLTSERASGDSVVSMEAYRADG